MDNEDLKYYLYTIIELECESLKEVLRDEVDKSITKYGKGEILDQVRNKWYTENKGRNTFK